ncbi:MAG TPA: hypothetical protein DCZ69_09925 [Syntrophobacteraceae bacterium]|nr:hypothetical protein [Syntrophobacteraceae bacterium]
MPLPAVEQPEGPQVKDSLSNQGKWKTLMVTIAGNRLLDTEYPDPAGNLIEPSSFSRLLSICQQRSGQFFPWISFRSQDYNLKTQPDMLANSRR